MDKTTATPLFDAATITCQQTYGDKERVASIIVRMASKLQMTFDVPPGWVVVEDADHPRMSNPVAVAEVLATMVEIGHRMTREELCQALEDKGRKRAESVVAEVLAQLMKFGVCDNRQNRAIKGYGIAGE